MKNRRIFISSGKKSFFLFLLAFIFCGLFATAQGKRAKANSSVGSRNGMSYGIRVGTTISQFSDQQPYTNIGQGAICGVFIRYGFSESFALQLETDYAQRGGRMTNFNLSGFFKVEDQYLRMHNLEVPLLAQYFIDLGGVDLKIEAGPAVGYNLHSGLNYQGTLFGDNNFHTYSGEENVSSDMESFEVSAIGGLGFEFDVSDGTFLFIDARYKYGVTPVYKGYSYVNLEKVKGDLSNHSMSFSIGVGF